MAKTPLKPLSNKKEYFKQVALTTTDKYAKIKALLKLK
jgi:hypothetical protein